MSTRKKQLRANLAKYPKEDIIQALLNRFQAEYLVGEMLIDLESMKQKRAIEKEKQAFDEERVAFDDYNEWLKQMAETYGDGKRVNIANIPAAELDKGIELGKCLEQAREVIPKVMKRTSAALGIKKKCSASQQTFP